MCNQTDQNQLFDQQIDAIENEIRQLQAGIATDAAESIPSALTATLDALFMELHTVITLKCIVTLDSENTVILDAIQHQKALKILDVAHMARLMSDHIEMLHDALAQVDGDARTLVLIKQTIAEFFIARQLLVDTAIHYTSEADNFCQCSTCLKATYHQFTAAFDYMCTQCETPFSNS